jgi:hypothetical protein
MAGDSKHHFSNSKDVPQRRHAADFQMIEQKIATFSKFYKKFQLTFLAKTEKFSAKTE